MWTEYEGPRPDDVNHVFCLIIIIFLQINPNKYRKKKKKEKNKCAPN